LKNQKLGYQNLKAVVYFDGENSEATTRIELVSNVQPKSLKYTIVNTYPHDIGAYTQGLEFYRDTLYEGTGQYGTSYLRKTDYKTGKVFKQINLDSKYFGEGITILNNKVYQLTWQNNEGFVYDADTFKKERTFTYFKPIEGWGLTNDGKLLYQSDGTEKIWILDPTTLKEVDYINVYSYETKIKAVNELEWINGKIFGNVYQKNAIAVINPKTGAVEGVINLADLENKITKLPDTDVLNGIAYNSKTKTIFVTGKNWDKMFEIKVSE
jgi:glutamine cyclotransferase